MYDEDGELLATQHFMVSSQGEAARLHNNTLGRNTLMKTTVMYDGIPVYKHDQENLFLYRDKNGSWCIGKCAGDTKAFLLQCYNSDDIPSVSPPKIIPWIYSQNGGWEIDVTLRVLPCY